MKLPESLRIALGEFGIGPRWDGERCPVCGRPLRSTHYHGVAVLPGPYGPPPPPPPMPSHSRPVSPCTCGGALEFVGHIHLRNCPLFIWSDE